MNIHVCVSDVDLALDTVSRLFSSTAAIKLMSHCVQQMSDTRLSVCRDLLVLVVLMQRLSEQVSIQGSLLDSLSLHYFKIWNSLPATVEGMDTSVNRRGTAADQGSRGLEKRCK